MKLRYSSTSVKFLDPDSMVIYKVFFSNNQAGKWAVVYRGNNMIASYKLTNYSHASKSMAKDLIERSINK